MCTPYFSFLRSLLPFSLILVFSSSYAQNLVINWGAGSNNPTARHYSTINATADFIQFNGFSGALDEIIWSYCDEGDGACPEASFTEISESGTSATVSSVSNTNIINITLTEVGELLRINIPSSATPGEYPLRIRLQTPGSIPIQISANFRTFNLIVRDPIQMVFVLDRSGSMECPIGEDTNWPDCSIEPDDLFEFTEVEDLLVAGVGSRWANLKYGLHSFLHKMDSETQVVEDDAFSVVYFAGNYVANPADTKMPITDPASSFINLASSNFLTDLNAFRGDPDFETALEEGVFLDMSSGDRQNRSIPVLAREGTSISEGIKEALNNRFDESESNFRKILILVTDGEETTEPRIRADGASNLYIDEQKAGESGFMNRDTEEIYLTGPGKTPKLDNVEIYTIAEKSTPEGTLFSLGPIDAEQPDFFAGAPDGMDAPSIDFINVIENLYNEIFDSYTPRFIKKGIHPLNNDMSFSFYVNKAVSQLIINTSFELNRIDEYGYRLLKNGNDMTQFVSHQNRSRKTITHVLDFHNIPDSLLNSRGLWELLVNEKNPCELQPCSRSNGEQEKVTFKATADDYLLDFEPQILEKNVYVNGTITPTLNLSYQHVPITDADTVFAIINKPGDEIGELLSQVDSKKFDSIEDREDFSIQVGGQYALRKLFIPTNDLNDFQSRIVPLIHTGGGSYEGSYSNVDVTGIYNVQWFLKHWVDSIGVIERFREETIVVGPGNINLSQSIRKAITDSEGGGSITVCPTYYSNDQGSFVSIGPGYSHLISFSSEEAEILEITDLGNGCYKLDLSILESPEPEVQICLYGDCFVDGLKLSELEELDDFLDGNILGRTTAYLEGRETATNAEETNFGNLLADANLKLAQSYDKSVKLSLLNARSMEKSIGEIFTLPSGQEFLLPPKGNLDAAKLDGDISQLDILQTLPANYGLSIVKLKVATLKDILEHSVAVPDSAASARFLQVGGLRFAYDSSKDIGDRVELIECIDEQGRTTGQYYDNGEYPKGEDHKMKVVLTSALLNDIDQYPFEPADLINRIDLNRVLSAEGKANFAPPGTEQDAFAECLIEQYYEEPFEAMETPFRKDERIINLSSPRSKLKNLRLVDAKTDKPIPAFDPLMDGTVINFSSLPSSQLSVEALTKSKAIESVTFSLSCMDTSGVDTLIWEYVDSKAPYTLFGEDGKDILPWQAGRIASGNYYTLTATPYSRKGAKGLRGGNLSRTFLFISVPTSRLRVKHMELVDTKDLNISMIFNDGGSIDLNDIQLPNILAHTEPERVGSVEFALQSLSGQKEDLIRIENNLPYALFGDEGTDFGSDPLPPGKYKLTVSPYSERLGQGELGNPSTIYFEVLAKQLINIVQVYPNPVFDQLTLSIRGFDPEERIQVIIRNIMNGKILSKKYHWGPQDVKIDLDHAESGIYFIQIISKNKTITHKFVKE